MNGGFQQPLCIGKVLQNQDKDHPNQVKVQLTALYEEGFNEIWAFLTEPYGGDQYGMSFVPEVDEQVIVAMVSGSVPVVLGCLRGPKSAPFSDNKENKCKTIKTKGGNEIKITDESGKSSISITTADGHRVTIEDQPKKLTVSDKDGKNQIVIDGKDNTMTLKTDKTFSVKVGGKEAVKITSTEVKITADKLTFKANNAMNADASQLKLSGKTAELKATGDLKVTSSGIATVKGSLLKLNG